jgi:hypothetical protein
MYRFLEIEDKKEYNIKSGDKGRTCPLKKIKICKKQSISAYQELSSVLF